MSPNLLKLKQPQELHQKSDEFTTLMSVLPGSLFFADIELKELEVVHLSTGYTNMSNAPWFDEAAERQRFLQRVRDVLSMVILHSGEPIRFEYRPVYQDKEFIFEGLLVKDHYRYIIHVQDRTRQHHLEHLVHQQDECLVRMTKLAAVGEMAGEIAHEINNPLTILNSSLYLLKRNYERHHLDIPIMQEIIGDMNSTIDRITKIIAGIRVVSRHSCSTEIAQVPLDRLIKDIEVLCKSRLRKGQIKLRKNYDSQVQIFCDRVQLSQVLINLLGNSIDAIEATHAPAKWIEIYHHQEEENCDTISITDSAEPLDLEIAARLFEPFYTTKDVGKGTGLGLVVSRKIVESHGGTIEFDGSHEHTRFVIKLPRLISNPT